MILYGYWRSSAAYRVRIALNLKGLAYEQRSVHLVKNGGEQHSAEFAELNPAELVPALVDGEVTLNQSLAIIEYLEAAYPMSQALVPKEPVAAAKVRAMALDVACDIHPLNNLRVLQYLGGELALEEATRTTWYQHWVEVGFRSLEKRLAQTAGRYCFGDEISLADVCLIPQVYNALRFNVDMSAYPIINRIWLACNELEAFQRAAPEAQPDAV